MWTLNIKAHKMCSDIQIIQSKMAHIQMWKQHRNSFKKKENGPMPFCSHTLKENI